MKSIRIKPELSSNWYLYHICNVGLVQYVSKVITFNPAENQLSRRNLMKIAREKRVKKNTRKKAEKMFILFKFFWSEEKQQEQ